MIDEVPRQLQNRNKQFAVSGIGPHARRRDYMGVVERLNLVPAEIAAGASPHTKMLKTLIESPDYPDITWGLRLAEANISRSGKILSFPLFCVFLMRRILRELDFPA